MTTMSSQDKTNTMTTNLKYNNSHERWRVDERKRRRMRGGGREKKRNGTSAGTIQVNDVTQNSALVK